MAGPRKHVPLRTCASCGTKTGKRELTRIVASPQGAIEVDTTGKLPGRGAYVCVQCAAGGSGERPNRVRPQDWTE